MNILELIKNKKKYREVLDYIQNAEKENIYIGNASINISRMIASQTFLNNNKFLIYTCTDTFEASKAYEVFVDLIGTDNVSFFPVEEFISTDLVASSSEFKLARMMTLSNIIKNTYPYSISILTINVYK